MNDKLKEWSDRCATIPGFLGCGVRLTDGTWVVQTARQNYPRERFEEVVRCLGDSLPSFATYGLLPRWLTWTFEKSQVRLAERADSLLLGVAVEPGTAAAQNIDLLTEEFFALNLTG